MREHLIYGTPVFDSAKTYTFPFVDKAEGNDKSAVNVWHNGHIIYQLSIKDKNNPLGKWYHGISADFRHKKKALRYAVTHGCTIRIICEVDGQEVYLEITKPKELNAVFHRVAFIPRMKIIKDGRFYDIRKGRLKPMRVWPVSQKLINEYENRYEKV